MGTPTTVTFRGDKKCCPTEKDAYIWLVRKFFDAYPLLLKEESIFKGRKVRYFASSTEALSSKIAKQASYYKHIILSSDPGKLFVNVKLDNTQKHQILSNMAKHAGLVEGTDWSWHNDSVKGTRTQRDEALARAVSEIQL